ncbi:MAG: helix-turn-helix domain-containing protein [Holosporaceae bacterium]
MRRYQQLSLDEREKMARLRQSESSIAEIALALGRTRSTVYRELKRNQTVKGDYWPERAQQKARASPSAPENKRDTFGAIAGATIGSRFCT